MKRKVHKQRIKLMQPAEGMFNRWRPISKTSLEYVIGFNVE
jgi:hypothetical protein